MFYLCTSFVLDEVWALESRASETKASQAHTGFELIWHDVLWGRADGRVEFAGIPSFSFPWVRPTETGSPRASEIKSQGPPQMWLPTQGNMASCCHCHFYSLVLHSLLPPTGLWDMIQIKLLTFASFFFSLSPEWDAALCLMRWTSFFSFFHFVPQGGGIHLSWIHGKRLLCFGQCCFLMLHRLIKICYLMYIQRKTSIGNIYCSSGDLGEVSDSVKGMSRVQYKLSSNESVCCIQ